MNARAVNQDVRVAEGKEGEIIVLSAYCPQCRRASMPSRGGRCGFCDSLILDEDTLSAKAMREQLKAQPPRPASKPKPELAVVVAAAAGSPRAVWTRELVIAAIQEHERTEGRPPTSKEWARRGDHPAAATVKGIFGSWADAIEAAGFARPTRGRRKRTISGPAPLAQKPAAVGAELRLASPEPAAVAVETRSPGPEKTPEPPPCVTRALIAAGRAFLDALEQELC